MSPTLRLVPILSQFFAYNRNTNPAIFLLKSDGGDHSFSNQSALQPCQYFSRLCFSGVRFLTYICTVVNNNSILSVCPTKSALNLTKSSFLHNAHFIFIQLSFTLLPLPPVLKLGWYFFIFTQNKSIVRWHCAAACCNATTSACWTSSSSMRLTAIRAVSRVRS